MRLSILSLSLSINDVSAFFVSICNRLRFEGVSIIRFTSSTTEAYFVIVGDIVGDFSETRDKRDCSARSSFSGDGGVGTLCVLDGLRFIVGLSLIRKLSKKTGFNTGRSEGLCSLLTRSELPLLVSSF